MLNVSGDASSAGGHNKKQKVVEHPPPIDFAASSPPPPIHGRLDSSLHTPFAASPSLFGSISPVAAYSSVVDISAEYDMDESIACQLSFDEAQPIVIPDSPPPAYESKVNNTTNCLTAANLFIIFCKNTHPRPFRLKARSARLRVTRSAGMKNLSSSVTLCWLCTTSLPLANSKGRGKNILSCKLFDSFFFFPATSQACAFHCASGRINLLQLVLRRHAHGLI
jgi:hypothetical protein